MGSSMAMRLAPNSVGTELNGGLWVSTRNSTVDRIL